MSKDLSNNKKRRNQDEEVSETAAVVKKPTVKVKLTSSVKYLGDRYKAGERITIFEEDLPDFKKAGVIVDEED